MEREQVWTYQTRSSVPFARFVPKSATLQAKCKDLEGIARAAAQAEQDLASPTQTLGNYAKPKQKRPPPHARLQPPAPVKPSPPQPKFPPGGTESKTAWREGSHVSTLLGYSGRLEYLGPLPSSMVQSLKSHLSTFLEQRMAQCQQQLLGGVAAAGDGGSDRLFSNAAATSSSEHPTAAEHISATQIEFETLRAFLHQAFNEKAQFAILSLIEAPQLLDETVFVKDDDVAASSASTASGSTSSSVTPRAPVYIATPLPPTMATFDWQLRSSRLRATGRSVDSSATAAVPKIDGITRAGLFIRKMLQARCCKVGRSGPSYGHTPFARASQQSSEYAIIYALGSHAQARGNDSASEPNSLGLKLGLGVGIETTMSGRDESLATKNRRRTSTVVPTKEDSIVTLVPPRSPSSGPVAPVALAAAATTSQVHSRSSEAVSPSPSVSSHLVLRQCELKTLYDVISGLESLLPFFPSNTALTRSALAAAGLGSMSSSLNLDLGGGTISLNARFRDTVGSRSWLILPAKWLRTSNPQPEHEQNLHASLLDYGTETLHSLLERDDSDANQHESSPDNNSSEINPYAIDSLAQVQTLEASSEVSHASRFDGDSQWRIPVPVRSAAARSALADSTLAPDTVTAATHVLSSSPRRSTGQERSQPPERPRRCLKDDSAHRSQGSSGGHHDGSSYSLAQHMSSAAYRQHLMATLRKAVRDREKKGLLPFKSDIEILEKGDAGLLSKLASVGGEHMSISASLLPLTSQAALTSRRLYNEALARLPGGAVDNAKTAWRIKRQLEAKYGGVRYGQLSALAQGTMPSLVREVTTDNLADEAAAGYSNLISSTRFRGPVHASDLREETEVPPSVPLTLHPHITETALETGFVALAHAGGDHVLETKRLMQLQRMSERLLPHQGAIHSHMHSLPSTPHYPHQGPSRSKQ